MLNQGLNFVPGSKLEAKDFNEKWYAARVVETDWIEREVLIHFDKWSTRFDEWIPMDSSRLRIFQSFPKDIKCKTFVVGERILATWVDGKKYPAKVNNVLGNDKYDVLFDDGYSKNLKASKITKLLHEEIINPQHTHLGSKQERRDRKRKHNISELFLSHSKKKIKNEGDGYKKPNFLLSNDVKHHSLDELNEPIPDSSLNLDTSAPKYEQFTKIKTNSTNNFFKFYPNNDNVNFKCLTENLESNTDFSNDDYSTYVGDLRIEIQDSTYKCPKSGCNKNFRKENLLQMHIKHYHPEYSKFVGSTPNVADLAYARTIGESFDEHNLKKVKSCLVQLTFETSSSSLFESSLGALEENKKDTNKKFSENHSLTIDDFTNDHNNSQSLYPDNSMNINSKNFKYLCGVKSLPITCHPCKDDPDNIKHLKYSELNGIEESKLIGKKKKDMKKKPFNYISSHPSTKANILKSKNSYSSDYISTEENNILHVSYDYDSNNGISSKLNSFTSINRDIIKVEKLRREEIINCTCGITEEDGLMIQCDLCLCWQHGHCNAIEKEIDVPEKYICYICQHAHHQRTSKKYFQDQNWILEGFLPSFNSKESLNSKKRSAVLKRMYDLMAGLIKMKQILYSLRIKVNVVLNKNHPKLYLWNKNWNKSILTDLKLEPVPAYKIIKYTNKIRNILSDDIKMIFKPSLVLKNINSKLITSDSELMRILEEDSTQVEESKLQIINILNSNGNFIEKKMINTPITKSENLEKEKPSYHKIGLKSIFKSKRIFHKNISENFVGLKKSKISTDKKRLFLSELTVPQPEALIDPVECKLHLLQHIEQFQNYIDSFLGLIEMQLPDFDYSCIEKHSYNNYVQIFMMLLNDLSSIIKLSAICS